MPNGPDDFEESDRVLAEAKGTTPAPEGSPAARRDEAKAKDAEQDVVLKRIVASIALGAVAVQIVVADWIFYLYGDAHGWQIEVPAISAWLGATVTEVIGLAYVITRYLFPRRDKK